MTSALSGHVALFHHKDQIAMTQHTRPADGASGPARVRLHVAERIGLPGTYSSVEIGCAVEISCQQTHADIREAEEKALKECLAFVDQHVGDAVNQLETHLKQVGGT